MRFNLALALLVSVLLVGSASWIRFANQQEVDAELVAIAKERQTDSEYYNEVILPVLEESAPLPRKDPEPLTTTDLVSRQLLVEYVQLASSGEASEKDIANLVERYVDSIPALVSVPAIGYADLSLEPNDKASLQRYNREMTGIYNTYASAMAKAEAQIAGPSPDYYSFAATASHVYALTAQKLKTIKIPGAVAQAHLGLTNSYLANSANLEAISRADEDSTSAFAALLSVSEKAGEERRWVEEIAFILKSNGI